MLARASRVAAAAALCWTFGSSTAGASAIPQERRVDVGDPNPGFVVLGHVRGGDGGELHGRLGELLAEVRDVDPAFVVLGGDNIWGDTRAAPGPSDPGFVLRQWVALDSALAVIGVPVFRVPGNHDIRDSVTYEIFRERYGELPAVVDVGRTRVLLLTTTWDPGRMDRRPAVRGFGYHLDAGQIEFLRARLAERDRYDRAFVVMHHVLWWESDDSPWWNEVHPILAEAGVDAVFTGDYGPVKFSHTTRDGVEYFQSVIAGDPDLPTRRGHEWNRILAAQFDNYLIVEPDDAGPNVRVATTGEVSSGHFTPEIWWSVHGGILRSSPSGRDYLARLWALPKGRLFLLALPLMGAAVGLLVGVMIRRRRS